MSQLKTNSITHVDNTGDPNITLAADGSVNVAALNSGQLAGFRSAIINGSMAIWQRGTSGSGTGYNGPDRWRSGSANPIVTRRTVASAACQAGVPCTYAAEVVGATSGGLLQTIEFPTGAGRQNGYDIGNVYTFSWYANTTSTVNQSSYSPIFTDNSDGLNSVNAATQTAIELIETLGASGWGRFKTTMTITGNVAGTNQGLRIGVASLNATAIQFTGLQFEPGPVATPFEHRPIGTELALCQRYYVAGEAYIRAAPQGSTRNGCSVFFPAFMRAVPTNGASTKAGFGNTLAIDYVTNSSMVGTGVPNAVGELFFSYNADAEL